MFKTQKVFDSDVVVPGDILLVQENPELKPSLELEPEVFVVVVTDVDAFTLQVFGSYERGRGGYFTKFTITLEDLDRYKFVYHLNPQMLLELLNNTRKEGD